MDPKIARLFSKHLLTEAEDDSVFGDEGPPADDGGASFGDSLDSESSTEDFDVDDLGFDQEEAFVDNFAEVYEHVYALKDLIANLMDKDNPKNLTTLLAIGERSDSMTQGLLQPLKKKMIKLSEEASSIIINLDSVAAAEPALRKKIEALKN